MTLTMRDPIVVATGAAEDALIDEAAAYRVLEQLRWADEPACPHCAHRGACTYLKPANGVWRRTRTGSKSARRVWRCLECRRQFSALTATTIHASKVAPTKWLAAAAAYGEDPGVTAEGLAAACGVCAPTAESMLALLRRAPAGRRNPASSGGAGFERLAGLLTPGAR